MGVLSQIRWRYLGLAAAVGVAACLSLAGVLPAPSCPFKTWINVSCPMCGTSRAWWSLLHGEPGMAFLHNPLFPLWGGLLALAFADLLHKAFSPRGPTVGELSLRAAGRNRWILAGCLACIVSMLFYVNAIGPTATSPAFPSLPNGSIRPAHSP